MKIKGNGSLREREKGVWIGRFNLGPDPDRPGKYLYSPSRTFHCEKEWEARAEMEKYREELEGGKIPNKDRERLHSYLSYWLDVRKGSHKSPRTAEREELDVRHIKELFDDVKMSKITPIYIKEAYESAKESGRFDKEIYQINKRLRQVLSAAVEDGIIEKNPASKVKIPRPTPEPKDYLDPAKLALFNQMLLEQPLTGYTIGAHVLLRTGMRPGEMLGLSWRNVNFARCRISIECQFSNDLILRAPKSKASRDWIAMDQELWTILFEWKQLQEAHLADVGLRQNPSTPVASSSAGGRISPSNYGRFFRNLCADHGFGYFETVTKTIKVNGVERLRGKDYRGLCPNMFRDIMATMLSGEIGVDPTTLQKRMRHSDVSVSLTYYSHPIEDNEYKAANSFSNLLCGK